MRATSACHTSAAELEVDVLRTLLIVVAGCAMLESCADDNVKTRWAFQPKLDARPDQSGSSSLTPCYCFPKGPHCHGSPFITVPDEAPADFPACPEGEACYAPSVSYTEGFSSGPKGTCRRMCFHAYADLPSYATTPELQPFWGMDCAEGERCALWADPGFESSIAASAGTCVPEPTTTTLEAH